MTIKNSLISVATASLLIAGFAGCGSSSSTTAATTTTSSTSSIQSSVKAVDGYIYNATVKAYYVNEDNTTMGSTTLTYTPTTKNTSTNAVTLGTSTYSLSATDEANTTLKNRIKFFTVATTASNDDGNVTFTPAAYIEADGANGYDTNDTLLGTTVIYAPATSGIASPITNLIYQANTALFGTTTIVGTAKADLNSTVIAQIESNATKLATNLGLSGVNLLTADPIELASTNATFKLATALLKDAGLTTANALIGATTAPTTLAGTIAAINTAVTNDTSVPVNAKTFIGTLNTLAQDGAISTTDLANMNIEKSVAQGSIQNLVAPTISGKFPVSSVTVDGVASSSLAAAGAKWDSTGTVDVNMTLASSDANVSNTAFSLLVAFKGTKDNMGYDDTNNSSSVVAEIPFELNITSGTVATNGIDAGSLIKYQVKSVNGSEVVTKTDINASTLGLSTGSTGDISVTSDILKFNINNIITQLNTAGDNNTTADLDAFDGIADVQVLVKDSTGAIVGATGTTSAPVYLPLAKANFTDIGTGSIIANEALKIVSNATIDMRNATTGANAAPSMVGIQSTSADLNLTSTGNNFSDANVTSDTIVITKGAGKKSIDLNITSIDETGEVNTTIVLSGLPSWATATSLTKILATNNGTADFNVTIDGNASVTTETNTTATFKSTDEFSKTAAANDRNVSFFFNLAPTITTKTATADTNVSFIYAGAVTNTNGAITDDGNLSASYCKVTARSIAWEGAGYQKDWNSTDCDVTVDGNLTIDSNNTDTNSTAWWVTFKLYDKYGAGSAEYNATTTGLTATGN